MYAKASNQFFVDDSMYSDFLPQVERLGLRDYRMPCTFSFLYAPETVVEPLLDNTQHQQKNMDQREKG